MTNINCTLNCIYQIEGKCSYDFISNSSLCTSSECAYLSICGADPVRNYSTQGDEYGFRPTSTLCKKNKKIIDHIFYLLDTRRDEVMPIFQKWITGVE